MLDPGRLKRALRAALLALILLGAGEARAQGRERGPAPVADTLFPEPPISAGGAFFRSVAIPGWAQADLGAPERGAFYFLMEAASLWMVIRTQRRLNHAERTSPGSSLVESRRQQREDWIALAVFWSLFSGADGWVSVQLYGFRERTGQRPGDVTALELGWKVPF